MDNEEWKDIPGYSDYQASCSGHIKRKTDSVSVTPRNSCLIGSKAGFVLSPYTYQKRKPSYPVVNIRGKPVQVSILVCLAFCGPRPNKNYQAAHNDGDPSNSRADNLRWATRKENSADKILHGTNVNRRGENHRDSKLTEHDVRDIRNLLSQGETLRTIGSKYGISHVNVSAIKTGKHWGWLK